MSSGQRRYPRIGPVLVRADCHLGDRQWEGYLTSLSEGGAYLVTDEPLEAGAQLSVSFVLPWQLGNIEVEAKVVHAISAPVEKPEGFPIGVGLAFIAPSASQVERLRRYVARFREIAERLVSSEA